MNAIPHGQKVARLNAEAFCKARDLVERRVRLAPLDAREVAATHVDVVRQRLLADAYSLAGRAQRPAECRPVISQRWPRLFAG